MAMASFFWLGLDSNELIIYKISILRYLSQINDE